MTVKELYQYAIDHKMEDLPIELIGIAECGYSAVMDTTFFIRKDTADNRNDHLQLIVTEMLCDNAQEELNELSVAYPGIVLSDSIQYRDSEFECQKHKREHDMFENLQNEAMDKIRLYMEELATKNHEIEDLKKRLSY